MDINRLNELAKIATSDPNFIKAGQDLLQSILDNIKDEPIDVNGPASRLLIARIKDILYCSLDHELSHKLLLRVADYQGKNKQK
jgi:hypothetical protein